jgi:uncharacterized repeat protein (TIGR03943 family)
MSIPARPVRALVLIAWAGFFLVLWMGGDADRYLGPRTTWVAPFGAILLSAAAWGYALLALRSRPTRRLTHLEGMGLLALLVPIVAVLVVPRAELGAQAARKKDTNRSIAAVQQGGAKRAAAEAAAAAAAARNQIADIDFLSLASVTTDPGYARDIGVKPGIRVRFLGFTVRTERPDRFRLARFLISCCAADAVPVFIDINAKGKPIPPDNDWLDVVGRLGREQGAFVVVAEKMTRTDAPAKSYLTTWGY